MAVRRIDVDSGLAYVIIGLSGRALAESAARCGMVVHVLDCCGDVDTRACAGSVATVGDLRTGIDEGRLLQALATLQTQGAVAGIVLGSGFEEHPRMIDTLSKSFVVFANGADAVTACTQPSQLLPMLDQLGIAYPPTQSHEPDVFDGWLVKSPDQCGGVHVRTAGAAGVSRVTAEHDNRIWQRQVCGEVYSLTLLGQGRRAWVLGANCCRVSPGQASPFRYYGAVRMPPAQVPELSTMSGAAQKIVARLDLRGLCGMDFIVSTEGECLLLDINPRPTATFELYETERGLFRNHLCCWDAPLVSPILERAIATELKGHAVVYAPDSVTIAAADWPDWVRDRTTPGTRIAAGLPVCSVHACGASVVDVWEKLDKRNVAVQDWLARGASHFRA